MSFLDDFSSEIEKNASKSLSNIFDYTTKQVLDSVQLVLVGDQPTGNLTEEQIRNGFRPGVPVINNNTSGLENSLQSTNQGQPWMTYLKIGGAVVGGLLLAYVIFGRKK